MGENSLELLGLAAALINNHRTKKALRRLQQENMANQGITHYQPSQIEAFFEDGEQLGNMAFSGGENGHRVRSIVRTIECACIQGYGVVVLHCANQSLEQGIVHYLGSSNVSVINHSNRIYDPFWGLTNSDISRLVLSSTSKGYEINAPGRYYLDGISDFIRAKKLQPYCQMYIGCPHLTLIDKVNDAETKGIISSNEARIIISEIMQGEIERGNIERFFTNFSMQSGAVLSAKADLCRATNIGITIGQNRIFMIDVLSNTNSLLINMLINEVGSLLSRGYRVLFVVDNIQLLSSEALQALNERSGSGCCLVFSSDDVYASFGGNDNAFFSFIGKASKAVISKHSSAYSCQKWSDIIGSYDKHEISNTYAQNTNYFGRWGLGSTQSANVNVKRENI
ncbi:MAG TPA: hypothetical protein VN456_09555, partial [Desulfosporosinus sp.]|nr:hypothetical protein [Desulfosporosinus sp.]